MAIAAKGRVKKAYERRERLRQFLVDRDAMEEDSDSDSDADASMGEGEEEVEEEFYTPGSEALQQTRAWLARYSLPRARRRLIAQRRNVEVTPSLWKQDRKHLYTGLKKTSIIATQVGADRPLATCAFAPNDIALATGGWDGALTAWRVADCEPILRWQGIPFSFARMLF